MKLVPILIMLVHVIMAPCLRAQDEGRLDDSKLIEMGDQIANSKDAPEFHDSVKKLNVELSKLAEKERMQLYTDLKEKIYKRGGWERVRKGEMHLIGCILGQAKDESFIIDLLIHTPPNNVGLISLDEYLEKVPVRIIASAIRGAAVNRVHHETERQ